MASSDPVALTWSAQFTVSPLSRTPPTLTGDKILLPPSALEQLLAAAPIVHSDTSFGPVTTTFDPYNPYTFAAEREARTRFQDRQQQLPHPLTFRLVNSSSGRVVYAGIREFSAEEGEVVLSKFLRQALGLEESISTGTAESTVSNTTLNPGGEDLSVDKTGDLKVTVHAKQIPKGTYVKLRPLEAGYDPADWKSLLEQYLRNNFTTLTNGEVLVVAGGWGSTGSREEFRFLVDGFQPEGDGICVVDTDLEVDIEALNEEQARETLKKIAAKTFRAPGSIQGSSTGGQINLFKEEQGQILNGEYVDYELPSWDRTQGIDIELTSAGDGEDDGEPLDLLISPFSKRQRAKPRGDEYVLADFSSNPTKRIRISHTNVELEDAEALWISVRSYPDASHSPEERQPLPNRFSIKVTPYEGREQVVSLGNQNSSDSPANPGEVQCKNCLHWVPEQSLFFHENFCFRNNIICPEGCGKLFQKRSSAFQNHWHCPHDSEVGNTLSSHSKHDALYHTPQTCSSCSSEFPSVLTLAHHRTTVCPGKLILCRFCHLEVPQEGDPNEPNPEALFSGLTTHELADGARTTDCHECKKIVRLRDVETHMKLHEIERLSRPPPRLCRNVNCGRDVDDAASGQNPGNDIGLCGVCYGPLYVSLYDPDGRALKRRVERRYLSQLLTGCGKDWCQNEYCRTGRKNKGLEDRAISIKEALPMVKPFVAGVTGDGSTPLHFCVIKGAERK